MANTLGREAYVEFKCFGVADDYPKSTEQAASELKARGYDASVPVLNYLIKQGKVAPPRDGRNYGWRPKDIDRAAAELDEQGAYTLEANTFRYLGIDAEQYHRALGEAWDKVRQEFGDAGTSINPVPDYFVMHVHPPRLGRDGFVEFTLSPDMARPLVESRESNRGVKGLTMPAEEKRRRPKR